LLDLLFEELGRDLASGAVGFVSGSVVDIQKLREDRRRLAIQNAPPAKCKEAVQILEYLNSLDYSLFDEILPRFCLTVDAVQKTSASPHARRHQAAILSQIRQCRQPFYGPVEKSTRVFPRGASLLNLSRDFRDPLLSHWGKIDLRQAHLRVVAKLWDMPELLTFVDASESFWTALAQQCGLAPGPEVKAGLKECLYSLIFGMSNRNLVSRVAGLFGDGAASKWSDHMVVSKLLASRKKRIRYLVDGGSLSDAFGNDLTPKLEQGKGDYRLCASALACQAQSYEMATLYPVVKYAKGTEGTSAPFWITLWAHDGFWFRCDQPDGAADHIESISSIISETSMSLLGFTLPIDAELPVMV